MGLPAGETGGQGTRRAQAHLHGVLTLRTRQPKSNRDTGKSNVQLVSGGNQWSRMASCFSRGSRRPGWGGVGPPSPSCTGPAEAGLGQILLFLGSNLSISSLSLFNWCCSMHSVVYSCWTSVFTSFSVAAFSWLKRSERKRLFLKI